MAKNKKTFIFYSDWINMVREMPSKDAGELLKHILSYVNDESPITDNVLVKMAFGHMEPMLKSDLVKWENQLQKYKDMGKLSAEKRKKQHKSTYVEPTLTQVEPVNTVNDNVNETVNEEKKEFMLGFGLFWHAYDKKVGDKTKIEKKWNKLSIETKQLILEYITKYKIAQPEKKYRKNPETFFNNESWLDEIIGDNGLSNQKIADLQKEL